MTENTARPGLLIALFLLTFAALSAVSILLPHDRYVRYQQMKDGLQFRVTWAYERSHFDRTPLDVVVIGNSRPTSGVSAPLLSKALAQRLGHPVSVANMSFAQEGENAHYVLVKQVLRDHPEVKLIVLSAIEQMPREGHALFKSIADPGDIVRAPILNNRSYFEDLASLPYRQISLFLKSEFPGVFGTRTALDPKLYFGTNFDTTTEHRATQTPITDFAQHKREVSALAAERAADITPPILPKSMEGIEFGMTRDYVRKSVVLAKRNGTQIAFLYQPIYAHPLALQDFGFYQSNGPVFQPQFLAGHPEFYADYAHMRTNGAVAETQWLGAQIADLVQSGKLRLEDR